jgi:GDPmannose 4,6-dehydratase
MARVLVTGVTGQIGSYLAEMLVDDRHEVLGLEGPDGKRLPAGVHAATGSLEDPEALLASNGALDAVLHLAARSSVAESWKDPMGTFDTNARVAAGLVFAARKNDGLRFVHASSAEIFGNAPEPVQNEDTPIAPVSPYAVAKASAHLAVKVAREGLGVRATNLVFYLGESPRRAPHFVFRKITRTVAAIACGDARELVLGTTSVIRDFCHARDLANAVRMAALAVPPGDYVCATGEGHSILDVAALACKLGGVDPKVIRSDPALVRANDVRSLVGDSTRLRALGWRPEVGFEALVREVLEHDLAAHRRAAQGTDAKEAMR